MNKALEKHILKIVEKYKDSMFLNMYSFNVQYQPEETKFMACKFSYPYLHCSIFYNIDAEKEFKEGKDMVQYVIHEMSHLITDPLYNIAFDRFLVKDTLENERERLTDWIANIVFKLARVNK